MRFNFRQISAIATSALMIGMTAGIAAAAAAPAPFVSGGVGDFAVVYGSASPNAIDQSPATSVATWLQGLATSGGTITPGAGSLALDAGGPSKIWLNTSLTNAKSIYTSSDFPTLLGSSVFSGGGTTATVTQTITLGSGVSGTTTNADNYGKVIFDKMPTANNDPNVGVSLTVGNMSAPLYNVTATFSSPINFTSSTVQGQTITLFGNQYTVSSSSSNANGIVLFSSASTINLAIGNSTTVTVNGVPHIVSLQAVSSTQAQLTVDGVSGTVTSGSTQLINGVSVGVTSVFPSSGVAGGSATILVGANQLTFTNGNNVLSGTSSNAILGTRAYIGGTGNVAANATSLTVAVQAPSISSASILKGGAFTDPVFGSFQITNAGLSIPHGVSGPMMDVIKVTPSGSYGMSLAFTDSNNNSGTFVWANNASSFNLSGGSASTPSAYQILPIEGANLSLYQETLTGTGSQGYLNGHLLQLQTVYNSSPASGGTYTASNDYVQYLDILSGQTIKTNSVSSAGTALMTIDGRQYTVTYAQNSSDGGAGWAVLKYPTADSSSTQYVLYPAIRTKQGAQIALYEPIGQNGTAAGTLYLNNLTGSASANISGISLSNGNGYTTLTIAESGGVASNYTLSGASVTPTTLNRTAYSGNVYANFTVGALKYNISVGVANNTIITMYTPSLGTPVTTPAVVLIEGKDVASTYNAVVIPLSATTSASSTVGVGTPAMSASTQFSSAYVSNTNWYGYMDYWGTLIVKDSSTSGAATATGYYPNNQVYEQLYLGPVSTATTGGNVSLGGVLVTDTNVASVSSHNLVVVGGSCINTVAASLVGGPYCGSAWTAATGVGTGQYLVQSFSRSGGKIALLVAGYEAAETAAAAQKLVSSPATFDTTVGNKYVGTVSTSGSSNVVKQ